MFERQRHSYYIDQDRVDILLIALGQEESGALFPILELCKYGRMNNPQEFRRIDSAKKKEVVRM
jgi:hypothetical protein